jgi:tartrate dehydrogenase/decarboxylase / D-malate dehydrogenase
MSKFKIAVIPGDGIGKEVIPEGIRALEAAGSKFNIEFQFDTFDWSCERYAKTGKMMPDDGLEQIRNHNAIYLGAVGFPGVPDHISLWGLLIPIRRQFQQYVNLRPVQLFSGVPCPLANRKPEDIDFIVVRENNEGEYSEIGGRLNRGTEDEICVQESVFTRKGTDRILKYAFEIARTRKKQLTSATKSNGIVHTMPFWDERVETVAKSYPDVKVNKFHIDILTAHFVLHPDWFDVVVGSNLFGDILSDLGPAPDIAGKGIANPIGAIWSAALMLEHLGKPKAAEAIMKAIRQVIAEGSAKTRDMGGKANTKECGAAIASAIWEN